MAAEPLEERLRNILGRMALAEKAALTAGADNWHTVAIGRLGIGRVKMTDGPIGARGAIYAGGPPSACFPAGVALAATWNPGLVRQVGVALAEEAKTKGARVLLGPTVNIHRSPLAGRSFECFSEDPWLSGQMAVAYVEGVQSQGVGACIKHFVCNDSEYERMSISSEVPERALREIYLAPFQAAVQEAKPWAVMGAYNRLNGVYCCENARLVQEILKGEWAFDGAVISDWVATRSTVESANHGLDLEMPGPAVWLGEKLIRAVKDGAVPESALDEMARRVLRLVARCGALEAAEPGEERAEDRPEHRQLIRRAAGEAIVLLKNDGRLLPLDANGLKRVAVIGPNAWVARIQAAGSAMVTPHYAVAPLDGIRAEVGDRAEVAFEAGCAGYRLAPLVRPDGLPDGVTANYWNNLDLGGRPVWQETLRTWERTWTSEVVPGVEWEAFSARLSGRFVPDASGRYTFGLSSAGPSRLLVDGQLVLDNWSGWQAGGLGLFGAANPEARVEVDLTAGRPIQLDVEFSRQQTHHLAGVRLGVIGPAAADGIERAAGLAAGSDVALVFVGLGDDWESEGYDRSSMDLPAEQVALVEAVAAANPRTVVVLQTGAPVTMPWLDRVPAVLQAWYGGQECGNAIADVLFGQVEPSGRLPLTFPRRLQDNPAYLNYPGEAGQVRYGEGIFVGYRYYDAKGIEPLFPFGHGLSYTTFSYGPVSVEPERVEMAERVRVSFDLTNSGRRAGHEVVQLYVRDVESSLARPEKELKGLAKLWLEPGETRRVTIELGPEALACYDPARPGWRAEPGEFELMIGRSSRDIRGRARLTLTQELSLGRPAQASSGLRLGVQSTVGQLLADPGARAILERRFPEMIGSPQLRLAMGFTLEQVAAFVPQILTPEIMASLQSELDLLAPVGAEQAHLAPKASLLQRLLARVAIWRARRQMG